MTTTPNHIATPNHISAPTHIATPNHSSTLSNNQFRYHDAVLRAFDRIA